MYMLLCGTYLQACVLFNYKNVYIYVFSVFVIIDQKVAKSAFNLDHILFFFVFLLRSLKRKKQKMNGF